MPATELSQQYQRTEARPARERHVTSPDVWRQGLPRAPEAAKDNDAPIARSAPAKRSMTLEGLLWWTYRQQLAHQVISMDHIQGPIDKYLWAMDQQGMLDLPSDRRQLHVDAAMIHEAVCDLGDDDAAMIIEFALFGDWPKWMDPAECRPYPAEPTDRYDSFRRHTYPDGRRINYRTRIVETVSIPKEEFELVGRKKMRRASISYEEVPVECGVLRWEPEPEFVDANNRIVARWQDRRPVLASRLRNVPFKDHTLAPDVPPTMAAANDNEPIAANDNEPLPGERAA